MTQFRLSPSGWTTSISGRWHYYRYQSGGKTKNVPVPVSLLADVEKAIEQRQPITEVLAIIHAEAEQSQTAA